MAFLEAKVAHVGAGRTSFSSHFSVHTNTQLIKLFSQLSCKLKTNFFSCSKMVSSLLQDNFNIFHFPAFLFQKKNNF